MYRYIITMDITATWNLTPKMKLYLALTAAVLSLTGLIGLTVDQIAKSGPCGNSQTNCTAERYEEDLVGLTCGAEIVNVTALQWQHLVGAACWSYNEKIPFGITDMTLSVHDCCHICNTIVV
jgi:hypothetical protein